MSHMKVNQLVVEELLAMRMRIGLLLLFGCFEHSIMGGEYIKWVISYDTLYNKKIDSKENFISWLKI